VALAGLSVGALLRGESVTFPLPALGRSGEGSSPWRMGWGGAVCGREEPWAGVVQAETHPEAEARKQKTYHIFDARTKRTAQKRYEKVLALRERYVKETPAETAQLFLGVPSPSSGQASRSCTASRLSHEMPSPGFGASARWNWPATTSARCPWLPSALASVSPGLWRWPTTLSPTRDGRPTSSCKTTPDVI